MALNQKLKFGPEDDELAVVREENAKLKLEKEALQKQVKALQEKPKIPKPPVPAKKSSIFLIIAALLVLARLALFMVVEAGGRRASDVGLALTAILGFVVVCMIVLWVIYDFGVEGWVVAGSMTFLLVAILICGSVFDPVLLETGQPGPVEHPLIAAAALIASFLFAASHAFRWIMSWLLLFVTEPKRALRFKR